MTKLSRIQFRLSTVNDKDLLRVLTQRLESDDNLTIAKETKRLMRLGLTHERLQKKHTVRL